MKEGEVTWDYHVIFIHKMQKVYADSSKKSQSYVYDFDSRAPFGCTFEEYCASTFRYPPSKQILQPLFRIVLCDSLLQNFASDRSHMKNNFKKFPPPTYDPIANANGDKHNLFNYLDCQEKKPFYGLPFIDYTKFQKFFASQP